MSNSNKNRDTTAITSLSSNISQRLHKLNIQMNDIEEKQNRSMSENTNSVREILTNTTIRSHENEKEIKTHIDKNIFKIEQSIKELYRVIGIGFVLILITQILMLFAMVNFYKDMNFYMESSLQKETQSHNANSVEDSTFIPK